MTTTTQLLTRFLSASSKEEIGRGKNWWVNRNRVHGVIRKFRERRPPLLVDISDGTNTPAEQSEISHLHQSDLLVLDYELDKALPEDGTLAINILRGLMSNDHFNLVVIYTQKELDAVFDMVRWGLIDESADFLSSGDMKKIEELIEEGENKIENLEQKLFEDLTSEGYFHSRLNPEKYLDEMMQGHQPYSRFYDRSQKVKWNPNQKKLVLRYLLKKIEQKYRPEDKQSFDLSWSKDAVKWIRSDSAFVAFSKKNYDGDLMAKLQLALNDWCPKPSRLFLAKIHAQMDESGFVAQKWALGNNHAAAYWYNRLLNAGDETERRWLVAESVSRHSDQLMGIVLLGVEDFAMRLAESEIDAKEEEGEKNESDRICMDRFNVNLGESNTKMLAVLEHNKFVCSKKPEGWYLTTGHIFSMCDGEYWVCLSPACDMVPSQISKGKTRNLGDSLLFIAVKLHEIPKDKTILEHVVSKRVVVLEIGGETKGFCFNNVPCEASAPRWNLLYAENRGKFENDLKFTVLRAVKESQELIFKSHEAEVIGQLRYEYALNLVQKLGVSLTRIGLDFSDGNDR